VARGLIQGYVERGGENVITDGRTSTTDVQRSFPLATVTVFNAGTVVLATIFSTEAGAPLANPFISDTDGHWAFWADQGRYDVQFSGSGIVSPYSLFNLETIIAAGLVDPGSNGFLARTSPNVLSARTFFGTTSAIIITNGDGAGNPVINLDVGLDFSGKTISGGTFIAPSISNFANAIHNHENAVGGGQLNATNVFSAGTVPVARLPIMVGASGIANGISGLVPQPLIGDQGNFLRGDGVWATAGGGGGGTPGGSNTTVQYNNTGAFGGISGATSDGTNLTCGSTNLRATRPRFITSIDDTNGNEVIGLISTGSAVNEISITNAGTGSHPTISSTGGDANPNININPKGSGIIATTGNIQVSNNAPQMAFIDVNDSKTVRISLSGANWSFINDTTGSTPLSFDTTTSLATFTGNVVITNTSPLLQFIDTNAADAEIAVNDGVMQFRQVGGAGIIGLTLSTGVASFGQIPDGPAADPTTANQFTRKQYVDNKKISFTASFAMIIDPSTVALGNPMFGVIIIPAGGQYTLTKAKILYTNGSHTSGGSLVFQIQQLGVGVISSLSLNNTNNTVNTVYTDDFGDFNVSENAVLWVLLNSRSGTITEKNVQVTLEGYRTPF
jgi:hypothetical protein